MAFTVSNFTSALKHQGARASLFDVTVTGAVVKNTVKGSPQKTLDDGTVIAAVEAVKEALQTPQDFTFSCKATTIPGLTVTSIPVMYFGREIKTPGEMEFADWSVTVLNDNNMRVRRFIGKWMEMINGHTGNTMATNFYKGSTAGEYSFTGDAHVQQYTKTGAPSSKYSMVQCWPIAMDPIAVSYDSVGTIQEYGVTFSMNYWTAYHENDISE